MTNVFNRGAFICIEGVDKVGKSTIASKLVEALRKQNLKAESCRFPSRDTAIGKLIDEYLRGQKPIDDHSIHLLFSANRWEFCKQMEKQLQSGTTLIVDRYAFSGVAYSAAKSNLSLEWCKSSDKGLLKPDLVLYLTASESVISTRGGFGDEIYERIEFQSKVKSIYERLKDESWTTFVNEKSVDEICAHLVKVVNDTIENVKEKQLQRLWV